MKYKQITALLVCVSLMFPSVHAFAAEELGAISAETGMTTDGSALESGNTTEAENQTSTGSLLNADFDGIFSDMSNSLLNGQSLTLSDAIQNNSDLKFSTDSKFDMSDMNLISSTAVDMGLVNMQYQNLSASLSDSFNGMDLSGKSQNCMSLFDNTYGGIAEQLSLSEPQLPEGFTVSNMIDSASSAVNSMYSSASNSGSFSSIKGSVSVGKIFSAANAGLSMPSLASDAELKSTIAGLDSANYSKAYSSYLTSKMDVKSHTRTDAVHLTNDMVPEMTEVLEMLFSLPEYSSFAVPIHLSASDKHYFDSSKVESHYAIVPTTKRSAGLSGDEEKLYRLIALVTICMVYPDAVMAKTELDTEVHGELFHTIGTAIASPGFYKVLGLPKEKLLPKMKEGDHVTSKFAIDAKQTEPPKRYTAATLLNAMLNCGKTMEDEELKKLMADGPGGKPRGLGRPSSRASIVATLENRGYTTLKGKSICPTDRGISMIQAFPVEELKSAVMTARWEKRLDDIEKGTDTYQSFMHDLEGSVVTWTNEILESDLKIAGAAEQYICPVCGKPVREFNWGYACQGNQDKSCNFKLGKSISGKKIPGSQIKKLFKTGKTDVIHGFKSKSGASFSAALAADQESKGLVFTFEEPKETDLLCPLCGSPLQTASWGYSCSAYKTTGCRFSIGTVAKKKLSEAQVKALLSGEHVMVKGMTSKSGNKFNAELYLGQAGDDKGKVLFDFSKSKPIKR